MANNTSRPKGQHYVPKMLLKHFCDNEGTIWVGDTRTKKVWRSKPCKALKVRHLYTRDSLKMESNYFPAKDYGCEEALGRLESAASPIIEHAIGQARAHRCSLISSEADRVIKEFMFTMARRTPESQQRVISARSFEDTFYQAAKTMADRERHPLPDKEELYKSIEVLRLVQRVKGNVFAKFAVGDDERVVEQVQKLNAETGLAFLVAAMPSRDFVIGSHGIGIMECAHDASHSFLPIAHDVCVWPTSDPDRTVLHILGNSDSWPIDRMNKATSARSKQIVGRTHRLIHSILQSVSNPRKLGRRSESLSEVVRRTVCTSRP